MLAIPSTAPLSEADTALLRRIAELTPRFAVLLTKAVFAAAAAAARRNSAARDDLRARLDAVCAGPVGVPALLFRLEREACDGALTHALAVVEPEIPRLSATLRDSLDVQSARWRGTLATAGADYEAWIRGELRPRLIAIANTHQVRLAEPLANFAANCEKLVADFHARLTDTVREGLGVTLSPTPWQPAFDPPKRPDVDVSSAFMFRFDWLWAVIPVATVRRWLRRHLRSRLLWEAEKNLSRVAAQWEGELRERIHELALAARQHIIAVVLLRLWGPVTLHCGLEVDGLFGLLPTRAEK